MVLPEAMAGAILCRARLSGKLNGEMPAIGPIGKRRTMALRPFDEGSRSRAMTSPSIRLASSAAVSSVKTPRSVSTSASRIGLPASSAMMRATSSRRSLSPSAIASSRVDALVGRHLARDLEGLLRADDRLFELLAGWPGRWCRRARRRRGCARPAGRQRSAIRQQRRSGKSVAADSCMAPRCRVFRVVVATGASFLYR